jgi:hypothetical protein
MNVVTAYFKVRAVRTFAWNYWKESIELWKYFISVPIFERQIQSKNISNPTLDTSWYWLLYMMESIDTRQILQLHFFFA